MRVYILQVIGLGSVNASRKIEGIVVLRGADFRQRHHAGIPRQFHLSIENVNDLMDVLSCRRFLFPSFLKPLEASTMKMPSRACAFSLSSTTMQAVFRCRRKD
jgi:hypothetical protein